VRGVAVIAIDQSEDRLVKALDGRDCAAVSPTGATQPGTTWAVKRKRSTARATEDVSMTGRIALPARR
jgi:hypothetical protein